MAEEGQTPEESLAQVNSVTNGRLQEIRFWVTIMKEHALFIALGLPCDQTDLIAQAQAFAEQFETLEERVRQVTTIGPELLEEIIAAVRALIAFQRGILALMLQCSIRPSIPPLFVDHITREAVHFLELLLDPAAAFEHDSADHQEIRILAAPDERAYRVYHPPARSPRSAS